MKTGIIVFFLCLLGFWPLFGQDSLVRTESKQVMSLYMVPSTIVDFTPRYRLGITIPLALRWEGAIAIGIGSQALNGRVNQMRWNNNYRFYEIRPEARYVLIEGRQLRFMLAAEAFYSYMECTFFNNSYHNEYERIGYDEAAFAKTKAGINTKAHLRVRLSPRVYTECYLGLGYGRRNIRYSHVVNPRPSNMYLEYEWDFTSFDRVGTRWLPQIPFGFTFGYVFLKPSK